MKRRLRPCSTEIKYKLFFRLTSLSHDRKLTSVILAVFEIRRKIRNDTSVWTQFIPSTRELRWTYILLIWMPKRISASHESKCKFHHNKKKPVESMDYMVLKVKNVWRVLGRSILIIVSMDRFWPPAASFRKYRRFTPLTQASDWSRRLLWRELLRSCHNFKPKL